MEEVQFQSIKDEGDWRIIGIWSDGQATTGKYSKEEMKVSKSKLLVVLVTNTNHFKKLKWPCTNSREAIRL